MSQQLSSLFSDESKAVFARSQKPKEFSSKRAPTIAEEKVEKKEKKPKHKRSRPESDSTEPDPSVNVVSDTINSDEKDCRTIFVGNISLSTSSKSLRKFVNTFGEVESLRLRSVPIAGTAVDEHGNQDLVKKVCTNAQMFGTQKGSLNAYVVFKSAESVIAALAADNSLVDGRHIRVDRLKPSMYDPKRSVFLGSLPFYVDEEELRNHFAKVLPNGHDDIEGVRVVRDSETLVGKGIGYLCLSNHDAVAKALTLDQSKFNKRKIRVTTCGKRTKRTEKSKNDLARTHRLQQQDQGTQHDDKEDAHVIKDNSKKRSSVSFSASESGEDKGKKKRRVQQESPAARRLKMKKALAQLAKKRNSTGTHTKAKPRKKQLGGVIKTAMKMAKRAGK